MGYIREPKNVDLVVAPSILTEDTKESIARAIDQYHKTGKKPVSVDNIAQTGNSDRHIAAKKTPSSRQVQVTHTSPRRFKRPA